MQNKEFCDAFNAAKHGEIKHFDSLMVFDVFHGCSKEAGVGIMSNGIDLTKVTKVNLGKGFYVSITSKYALTFGPCVLKMKLTISNCLILKETPVDFMKFRRNIQCKYAAAGVFDSNCPGQFCIFDTSCCTDIKMV